MRFPHADMRRDPEKYRAWQDRSQRNQRERQRDRPRAPIPARNEDRAQKLFERNYFSEDFVKWTKGQPCVVSGKKSQRGDPVVSAHVRGKGAGGRWSDVVPMLASIHDDLHQLGPSKWEAKYEFRFADLKPLADAHAHAWRVKEGIPE